MSDISIPNDPHTHYAAEEPKHPFRAAWRLIRPYWVSEERWRARALLATVLILSLGQVFISVRLNKWNNAFYNALQDHDLPAFWHLLGVFCLLAFCFIVAAVYQSFLRQLLHIRWRRWLTFRLQARWLERRNYYRLQVLNHSLDFRADNPDQRIADDVDGLTGSTLSLGIDFLNSVVTLVSFTTILWGLSGSLDVTLFGTAVTIPGYMLWVALLYASVGTVITHLIGRKLIGLNYEQQRREANFRFGLIRIRENAEPIAFLGGEAAEDANLRARFTAITGNWRALINKQKQLAWFTVGYAQIASIFAIVVGAPRYFSGAIQLGGLMQIASAFGQVQESLSWLINVYPSFAGWKATVDRLDGFSRALDGALPAGIVRQDGPQLALTALSLIRPDGTPLIVQPLSLTLAPGERLLVTGPSGSGKTTVLRALAGLWPYGSGTIVMPAQAKLLFVPQRAYLPLGTLRQALLYPATTGVDEAELTSALTQVGLGALTAELDREEHWAQRLSPGEQQKLGFARALLMRPNILLLDEATSALDEASEAQLYQLLLSTLPKTILVSVGHRTTLASFHTRTLSL